MVHAEVGERAREAAGQADQSVTIALNDGALAPVTATSSTASAARVMENYHTAP